MDVTFDIEINDVVWVVDTTLSTIKRGTCMQSVAMVQLDADEEVETLITYLILLDNDEGTVVVADSSVFATFAAASEALEDSFS